MSDPVEVVEWIDEEEVGLRKDLDHDGSLGGLGGWFGYVPRGLKNPRQEGLVLNGQRWPDYLAAFTEDKHPRLEAIRKSVVENRIRVGGIVAQEIECVPVLSDGTYFLGSMRGWGDLMAAIWSSEDNKDYGYADFAWTCRPDE